MWKSLVPLLLCSTLFAQDPRQIIEETQQRSRSKSQHYEGTLELHDSKGQVTTKRWTFDRLGSSGESKSLLRFTAPVELKGVALLIVGHRDGSTDQWMWTPAVDRERRIAMQDRSTRFFGTDFSFEDLQERDPDQFDYKLLGNDTVGGALCWKLESKPKQSQSSQYSSSTLWVRKDNNVIVQVDNYNRDKLVRKIRYGDIVKQNNIWTPRNIEVLDAARNSRTVLKIDKLEYNLPMKPEDFTVEALRH
ncbi:MAG: outer membrane lipoprotein-sorting protein [Acidobacteriota bacterium]|nr:outer membrane lipoprotein-sorting protein [Acidobacteriota bacterium]